MGNSYPPAVKGFGFGGNSTNIQFCALVYNKNVIIILSLQRIVYIYLCYKFKVITNGSNGGYRGKGRHNPRPLFNK